jgi:16S rRNA processing protein RimM
LTGEAQRWVLVARILRPRGNKGEVAAEILTDFPKRLTTLKEIFLRSSGGQSEAEPRRTAVKICWLSQNHPGQIVFHFEGCDSISKAEELRGLEVLLPFAQRIAPPGGHYFVSDLIGCSVHEIPKEISAVSSSPCYGAEAPALLGTVRDVQFTGEGTAGTPILVVDTAQGEVLIPLAEDICKMIRIEERRIEVALPEGLRELNAE